MASAPPINSPIHHKGIKTFWHLQAQRRIPTDYEIASTKLLYYRTHGFAVDTPAATWMREHAADLDLRCNDWDGFADPAAMTYNDYVCARRAQESVVAGALRLARENRPDFTRRWQTTLARVLAPMRYPWHGLQMTSAYLAHLAPGSRIAIAALFQTADLLRCVEALMRRSQILRMFEPTFGDNARKSWEDDRFWQPTRAVIERLLTTYRWGECFAALNLVVKPVLDQWLLHHLSDLAKLEDDEATRLLLWSIHEDTLWHRAWTAKLAAQLSANEDNRNALLRWIAHWRAQMEPVESSFAPLFDGNFSQWRSAVQASQHSLMDAAGLGGVRR